MPLTGQVKRDYQRKWVRAKRLRQRLLSNQTPDSVEPTVEPSVRDTIQSRIDAVRPSNGTEQDDIRAAGDRLEAALGGPAIEPINEPFFGPIPDIDADGNPMPEY